MSAVAAFAMVLEKRAAVSIERDLEDRAARKRAQDDVAELKASRSRAAYAVGAVGGAAAGTAVPTLMRLSEYFSNTPARLAEVSQRVRVEKMSNLAKSMGFKNHEALGQTLARYLEDQGRTEAHAHSIAGVRSKALFDHATKAGEGAHPLNEKLVAEVEARVQHPLAAFVPDSGEDAVAVGAKRLQDHLNAMRTAGGVGAEENKHLWDLADKAGAIDEKAIRHQLLGEELGRTARGAAPFAILGALTGLMAVRARRKRLEEIERG